MNCSGFVSTSDQSLYNHIIIDLRTPSICSFISNQLHGYFNGIEPTRLTKQKVEFYDKRSYTKMILVKWMIPAIKEDLDAPAHLILFYTIPRFTTCLMYFL